MDELLVTGTLQSMSRFVQRERINVLWGDLVPLEFQCSMLNGTCGSSDWVSNAKDWGAEQGARQFSGSFLRGEGAPRHWGRRTEKQVKGNLLHHMICLFALSKWVLDSPFYNLYFLCCLYSHVYNIVLSCQKFNQMKGDVLNSGD